LIEHYAGNFPTWLAPQQVAILPIAEKFNDYGEKVSKLLKNAELRSTVDYRNEKVGRKIRDAEMMKIPYMLIVGEKETQQETVSVRKHGTGDIGSSSVGDLIQTLQKEIQSAFN